MCVHMNCRRLMLPTHSGCYLITQNYEFRKLNLCFPVRHDRLQPGHDRNVVVLHHWTVLYGELVSN